MVEAIDSKLERLERRLRRLAARAMLVDEGENGDGGGEPMSLIGLGTWTMKNSDGNGCANDVSGGEGPGHDQDGSGSSRSGGGLGLAESLRVAVRCKLPPGRCCGPGCSLVIEDDLSEDVNLDGVASADLCLRRRF